MCTYRQSQIERDCVCEREREKWWLHAQLANTQTGNPCHHTPCHDHCSHQRPQQLEHPAAGRLDTNTMTPNKLTCTVLAFTSRFALHSNQWAHSFLPRNYIIRHYRLSTLQRGASSFCSSILASIDGPTASCTGFN